MQKKILVVLSVLVNLAVLAALGVGLWLYSNPAELRDLVIGRARERVASFYEQFGVGRGEYVFLGDSITHGGLWSEMFPTTPVKGRGVGGDTTSDLLERLGAVTRGQPARLYIMIGTNDLTLGVERQQTLANYREILERVRRESPATEIYVQSVLPRAVEYRDRIVELNRDIESLALSRGAHFIDLYAAFLGPDGSIRNDYRNDELHLTGLGYRRWQQELLPHVVEQPASPSRID